MGFDPRRWRPSSGSRPLTTNVEALLAENEALRREVRSLRLQLEALLQGDGRDSRSWDPPRGASEANAAAAETHSRWTTDAGAKVTDAAQQRGGPWSSAARSRASRSPWSSPEPPRSRVTVGTSHGISADLVERWGCALARHPRWPELRIGPPGGLRGLEQELRRQWWNPALSLEQELERRSPGLGAELTEALRGPHSRIRWAVRSAFALYGPRAPEWLSEDPLRVVEELLRRVQQLDRQAGTDPSARRGSRTDHHSGGSAGRSTSSHGASAGEASHAAGRGSSRSAGRSNSGSSPGADRQAEAGRRAGGQASGSGAWSGSTGQAAGQAGPHQSHGAGRTSQEQASAGSQRASSRQAPPRDPRSQALALLGLEPGASAAAIKRAYRRLAKAHHPDLGGDAEAFLRLDAAYRSLL